MDHPQFGPPHQGVPKIKIISPFHDFYDSALVYHNDSDSVIYQRQPITQKLDKQIHPLYQEINSKFNKYLCNTYRYFQNRHIQLDCQIWTFASNRRQNFFKIKKSSSLVYQIKHLIIFCSKIYPVVEFVSYQQNPPERVFIYTEQEFLSYLDKYKETLSDSQDYKYVSYFFSNSGKAVEQEFLIENKITNIELNEHYININPKLSDLEFYRVFDAYTCYQELEAWMAGTLAYPQNMMIEVEDKSKIEKHGFDTKYGFRTRPK